MTPPATASAHHSSPAPGSADARSDPSRRTFRDDVLAGLSASPQKTLPCKYLYDARGCALFDRICQLPEYYPTRTELGILRTHARDIAATLGAGVTLAELGSGSSTKTRILIEHLIRPTAYIPIDIARDHLFASARALAAAYPRLDVRPLWADYSQPFTLPTRDHSPSRLALFFPGSTIGNLDPDEAQAFLDRLHRMASPDAAPAPAPASTAGGLLIGVDLRKSPSILLPAYDDAEGVTAAFNGNLLVRINREFAGDFRLDRFAHRAVWNEAQSRMEMHLVALEDQAVHLAGRRFAFTAGESIHTENSYKWSLDRFVALAAAAGWTHRHTWIDPHRWFALLWLEA